MIYPMRECKKPTLPFLTGLIEPNFPQIIIQNDEYFLDKLFQVDNQLTVSLIYQSFVRRYNMI